MTHPLDIKTIDLGAMPKETEVAVIRLNRRVEELRVRFADGKAILIGIYQRSKEEEGKNWYYDGDELVITKGSWVVSRINTKNNLEGKLISDYLQKGKTNDTYTAIHKEDER